MKTKYDEKIIKKAKADYKKGVTLKEISKKYKIPYSTVQTWKKRYWTNINGVDGRKDNGINAINNEGSFSYPYLKFMTEEEQNVFLQMHTSPEEQLQLEINLCTVSEMRILANINKFRESEDYGASQVKIAEKSTYIKENGKKTRVESRKENSINILLRLEAELAKVQGKKIQAIKELASLKAEKIKLENEDKTNTAVNDWITATIETGGDEFEI